MELMDAPVRQARCAVAIVSEEPPPEQLQRTFSEIMEKMAIPVRMGNDGKMSKQSLAGYIVQLTRLGPVRLMRVAGTVLKLVVIAAAVKQISILILEKFLEDPWTEVFEKAMEESSGQTREAVQNLAGEVDQLE